MLTCNLLAIALTFTLFFKCSLKQCNFLKSAPMGDILFQNDNFAIKAIEELKLYTI